MAINFCIPLKRIPSCFEYPSDRRFSQTNKYNQIKSIENKYARVVLRPRNSYRKISSIFIAALDELLLGLGIRCGCNLFPGVLKRRIVNRRFYWNSFFLFCVHARPRYDLAQVRSCSRTAVLPLSPRPARHASPRGVPVAGRRPPRHNRRQRPDFTTDALDLDLRDPHAPSRPDNAIPCPSPCRRSPSCPTLERRETGLGSVLVIRLIADARCSDFPRQITTNSERYFNNTKTHKLTH